MRDSLLPQMMGSLGRNASRQVSDAKLFEIGKVFSAGPSESERISLGFTGPVGREALRRRAQVTEEEAVLWMKGAVETLLSRLHAGKVEFAAAEHPAFAKGAALEVKLNGRAIGVMGALSAKLRHPYRLTTQMALCELELKPLCKRVNAVGRVSAVAQFPAVTRDIALVADRGVTNEAIVGVIRRNGGKELTKIELFDIFKSKELKDGRRSLAYALEFRSAEKTLTDVEVGKSFQRIVDALKATAGIEVRES
jgi:phenylalanyl-tRNA synthetase beta chain